MTAPSTAAAVTCKEKPALTVNDPELARRAEEAGLNALPAPRQVLLDGWLLRFADGCTRRAMLAGLAIPAAFGAVRFGGPGTPLASLAYAAVHDGLACINMVATDPAARRRGLSRRVLLRLLAWAREAGAEGACLQVAADNAAAIPLYEGFGFRTDLYCYHYRRLGG